MSDERLREENTKLAERIQRLELALLNAEAIKSTYLSFGPKFDEIYERLNRTDGRITNVEGELGNQKMLIVKALQGKIGTGPTA